MNLSLKKKSRLIKIKRTNMQDVYMQDPTFINFVPRTAGEAVDRFTLQTPGPERLPHPRVRD